MCRRVKVIFRYFFLGSDGPDIHQIYTESSDWIVEQRRKDYCLLKLSNFTLKAGEPYDQQHHVFIKPVSYNSRPTSKSRRISKFP